ncbi:hypothetical protein K504DRAFT_464195 [Pleomassaria siparia CBS 279.74]|uniref:Uncharacterized protein n=1 Tax=Pleomassaria siparia CBS 279.74 TaxID=1314801 RepID=A0A6G1KHT0_9PLEO|nr:hypothetical protein K504DRAFT_464195 [Pleomassaria siparia CBS 279.74]
MTYSPIRPTLTTSSSRHRLQTFFLGHFTPMSKRTEFGPHGHIFVNRFVTMVRN